MTFTADHGFISLATGDARLEGNQPWHPGCVGHLQGDTMDFYGTNMP